MPDSIIQATYTECLSKGTLLRSIDALGTRPFLEVTSMFSLQSVSRQGVLSLAATVVAQYASKVKWITALVLGFALALLGNPWIARLVINQ